MWLAEPYVYGGLMVLGYDRAIGPPAWLADLIADGSVRVRREA